MDSDARRVAPPMNPALSLSVLLPSISLVLVDSCLERRFSLLKIDLMPLDEVGEVGEVGSDEEGSVVMESRVGAVLVECVAAVVPSDIPVRAVGSS